MKFNVAYIKNNQQFLLKNFSEAQELTKASHINLDEMGDQSIDAIFLPQELSDDQEVIDILEKQIHLCPIRPLGPEEMTSDQFDVITRENMSSLFQKTHHTWVLKNNLALLEKIVPTTRHLKALWPNDRTAFFEELWHLLKKNIGASSLRVAYNHMQKAQKEGEKNKLIRVIVEGDLKPSPVENKELGEALFKNYEGKFSHHFEVYDESNSHENVCLATVNESPIIIMANSFPLTQIQRSLLTAFFDSLQA